MDYVASEYCVSGYVDTGPSLTSALQDVSPGAVIELFQLILNIKQHGLLQTLYFHAGTNQLDTNVIWQGNTYAAIPIEADGFEWDGQGSLPRPKIRVANILGTITNLILSLPDGLEGAKVVRIRTLARFLDAANFSSNTNPEADPTASWEPEIYYVDRKSSETRVAVEYELASAFDLVGVRVPKRQCVTRCQWVYRSAECGYKGTDFFNEKDEEVTSSALDVCSKQLSGCELRFGQFTELPFGGFPGIGTFFV
jgi:lambda family phage minor tail protein L